jgi:hypothetical protein
MGHIDRTELVVEIIHYGTGDFHPHRSLESGPFGPGGVLIAATRAGGDNCWTLSRSACTSVPTAGRMR